MRIWLPLVGLLALVGSSALSPAGSRPEAPVAEEHWEQASQGEEPDAQCVGGCSFVKDEAPDLSRADFRRHLAAYASPQKEISQPAWEALLFHHTRARKLLAAEEQVTLPPERLAHLQRELKKTHVWLDVRLTDARGVERLRLEPQRVPLGQKTHHWPQRRIGLQAVDVNGSIRRVGERHLWARL